MSHLRVLDIASRLLAYESDDEDAVRIDRTVHLRMLEMLVLIRQFELLLIELDTQGLVHGPLHSSIGQEGVAVGCGAALQRHDLVGSTHRAHHHFLAKALQFFMPDAYDPLTSDFTPEMQSCVEKTLAEVLGLKSGWCGGRGGSMHLRSAEAGIIGTNAIVGGGIALTTGAAWALHLKNTGNIAVSFFGDGAVNQGIFLESANMAQLFRIPVIYFIENNLYAVGTPAQKSSSTGHLVQRALGFGMDGIIVDGMDPAAVYLLICGLRDQLQNEGGPRCVEAETYRFYHHKGSMPGSKLGYRTLKEEQKWRLRDPYQVYPEKLKRLGILDETSFSTIRKKVDRVLDRACSAHTESLQNGRVVRSNLWPASHSLVRGSAGSGNEFRNVVFQEREDFASFTTLTFINVISQVAARNMEKDRAIIVLGEEVANFNGGAYNATKFVMRKFPERTFNTPISEAGFVGIAFGACLCGMKPIVEIMFPDFCYVAADQLFNQIAKLKYLYGGRDEVLLVLRTRIAAGLGYGAQHSSDPGGLFALFAGWRIVAPSSPFDYVGLFNSAIICRDPVLVMEHQALYREKGEVPKGNLDYCIPLGRARVLWHGTDATVVTYLRGVRYMETIRTDLERAGLNVECIDLRSLDYASIDYDTIARSLEKTGSLIVVEEASRSMGIGARLADEVQERFFHLLKRPVRHLNSRDIPMPVSRSLEKEVLINPESILEALASYLR